MVKGLWILTVVLLVQAVHSYILLTANIDDIRNIGKRVASSPIVGQVGGIMRRAYDAFNTHLNRARARMRSDDKDLVFSYHPSDPYNTDWRKNQNSRRSSEDQLNDKDQNNRDQINNRYQANNKDQGTNKDQASNKETKDDTFSSLGKSASVYLEKIKSIFEKANPGKSWDEQIADE